MRLIDGDFAEELLLAHEQNARSMEASGRKVSFTYADGIRTGYADVSMCPTVDAELVRRGHWVRTDNGWFCSNCERTTVFYAMQDGNYCPRCGAKMSGEVIKHDDTD